MNKLIFLLLVTVSMGCKVNLDNSSSGEQAHNEKSIFKPQFTPGPHVIVYKTHTDYYHNVPVTLNEDGSSITSYPDPTDLLKGGTYRTPTKLKKEYLLDNKGINGQVAFLNITYENYARLAESPSTDFLYKAILDKDPLTELCDCGHIDAFTNVEKQLNELIKNGKLRIVCEVIK